MNPNIENNSYLANLVDNLKNSIGYYQEQVNKSKKIIADQYLEQTKIAAKLQDAEQALRVINAGKSGECKCQ